MSHLERGSLRLVSLKIFQSYSDKYRVMFKRNNSAFIRKAKKQKQPQFIRRK